MSIYLQLPDTEPGTSARLEFVAEVTGEINNNDAPRMFVELGPRSETLELTPLGGNDWYGSLTALMGEGPHEAGMRFQSAAPALTPAPIAIVRTATYIYTPPETTTTGVWPVRQRQSLIGPGSWPLRQRQNGGHSGSWAVRQRQTGV